VFQGARGTARDMNASLGNPVGFVGDYNVKRAFAKNTMQQSQSRDNLNTMSVARGQMKNPYGSK
jgi:hypothetical protein